MGTSAIVTPPTGALLDRHSAKALVVAGSLASAFGYAGFAFVERPWQGFACSIVSGVGLGVAGTANRTLLVRLITPEQRAAAFALNRVAGSFGIGSGAAVGGFIVAAAQPLSTFGSAVGRDLVQPGAQGRTFRRDFRLSTRDDSCLLRRQPLPTRTKGKTYQPRQHSQDECSRAPDLRICDPGPAWTSGL